MAVFNHTGHKEMWGWLADNPTKEKDEWPGWKQNGGEYHIVAEYCFACEYDYVVSDCASVGNCRHCPLKGMSDETSYDCLDGDYEEWRYADSVKDLAERKRLAEKIRDWPVKDGVETI